jgi:hypothetical protein
MIGIANTHRVARMNTCNLVVSGLAALALLAHGRQSLNHEIETMGG